MEHITYTQQEVESNINKLTTLSDSLKLERTALSQQINSIKKQIQEWEDLDKSQFKMF